MNCDLVALGNLCEVSTGQSAPQDADAFSAAGHPFIRAGSLDHLVKGGGVDVLEKISEENARRFRMKLFPVGTIVFAKSGMSATLGRVYRLSSPCYVVSHLATLIPKSELDGNFLLRWLEANPPSCLIANEAYPSIKTSEIQNVQIPVPELADQRRIALILDKADAIRRKRGEALKLAEGSIRSAFLQLVGKLPNDRVAIEDLLAATSNAIRTGPFGSQLLHAEFTDRGIPVLGIDNVVTNRFRWAERRYVSNDKYKELRRYRVFPGDVMITIMGTTGRVCIAPVNLPECISTKHLCTITPDRQRLLPEYLWASLMWDPVVRAQAAREGKGAIMEGWNMGLVRGLMIKLPPIAQQERFAAFVRKAEGLRVKLLAAEAESNQLFGSLAQRAFSGQL